MKEQIKILRNDVNLVERYRKLEIFNTYDSLSVEFIFLKKILLVYYMKVPKILFVK